MNKYCERCYLRDAKPCMECSTCNPGHKNFRPASHISTNADRIRAMSDEELAGFLDALCSDGRCGICDNLYWCRRNNAAEPICKNHICDWLKKHTGEE